MNCQGLNAPFFFLTEATVSALFNYKFCLVVPSMYILEYTHIY